MSKILQSVSAIVLLSLTTVVSAQSTGVQSVAAAKATATDQVGVSEDRGTALRLASLDTSVAAFRKLDKDNDGRISPLEAADNPKVAAAFTRADKDKDGYLSQEEFEALSSASPSGPDVSATSPSGDRATDPGGDQPATGPNDNSANTNTSAAPAPTHSIVHPRQ